MVNLNSKFPQMPNHQFKADPELALIKRTHFSNLEKEVSNAERQQPQEDLAVYERV